MTCQRSLGIMKPGTQPKEHAMTEDRSHLGPGIRLPLISGFRAFPKHWRVIYRDVMSNEEPLKILDAMERPGGSFFLIPETLEEHHDVPWRGNAILCVIGTDSTLNNRPCL